MEKGNVISIYYIYTYITNIMHICLLYTYNMFNMYGILPSTNNGKILTCIGMLIYSKDIRVSEVSNHRQIIDEINKVVNS